MNLLIPRIPSLYESMFSEFFGTWSQDEKGWTAEVELPGFDPSEVEVEAHAWEVRVKAKQGQKTKNVTLSLPTEGVVSAKMKNGLLTLNLTTESQNKKISIATE